MALSELQRGCNFGLKKPLAIVTSMFHELEEVVPEFNSHATGDKDLSAMMDAGPESDMMPPLVSSGAIMNFSPNEVNTADGFDHSESFLNFLDGQEMLISDHTLFGLFAEPPSWS